MFNRGNTTQRAKNPYEKASVFSKLTFLHLKNFLKSGSQIGETDLYAALKDHKSSRLVTDFENDWNEEKKKKKPSLFKTVFRLHGVSIFILSGVRTLIEGFTSAFSPYCIGGLVSYFVPGQIDMTKYDAYLFALGLLLCFMTPLLTFHPYQFHSNGVKLKLKAAISGILYRKALNLSKPTINYDVPGQLSNLMVTDIENLDFLLWLHDMWKGPYETVALGYFMYKEVGTAAMVGMGFMMLFMPVQMWYSRKTAKLTDTYSDRTYARINFINELLHNIQLIKMQAWEAGFVRIVNKLRKKESDVSRQVVYIRSLLISFISVSRLSIMITIFGLVYFNQSITARKIFIVTSIFNYINISIVQLWPVTIQHYSDCLDAMKRIQTFLEQTESKDSLYQLTQDVHGASDKEMHEEVTKLLAPGRKENQNASDKNLKLRNLTAKWSDESEYHEIYSVNLDVIPGKPCLVVGSAGSSKSSLLSVIIGEMEIDQGVVIINGVFSYASSHPWIFDGSIRQNIIFTEDFDSTRYSRVCDICALESDFGRLENGDETIIGRKGVVFSMALKARVNLARALYKNADIYLLDDPFSSVDIDERSFKKCIDEFLKDKCVVITTDQLKFIDHVDHIVVMESGQIKCQGKLDEVDISQIKSIIDENNVEQYDDLEEVEGLDETEENDIEQPVGFDVLVSYIKSVDCVGLVAAVILTCILEQLTVRSLDYYLGQYVNWEESRVALNNTSEISESSMLRRNHLTNYGILSGLTAALRLIKPIVFYIFALRVSKKLHEKMLSGVMNGSAEKSSARVLNRMSRDVVAIDDFIPSSLLDTLSFSFEFMGILLMLTLTNAWLFVPTCAIIIIFVLIKNVYIGTSQRMSHLEVKTHSPVLAHAFQTMDGISTIRAHNAQNMMIEKFDAAQDLHSSATFTNFGISCAFAYWVDVINFIYISIVVLSFLVFDGNMSTFLSGTVGCAISNAVGLIGFCQWGISGMSSLQNHLKSVKRAEEYGDLATEEERPIKMNSDWPVQGVINFENVCLDEHFGDNRLNSLSFKILGQEKVGIIGAGNSSIIQALFRLAKTNGLIKIDDVDIKTLELPCLRSEITIITQDPIIFSETVRFNVDPNEVKSDTEIMHALGKVKLKSFVMQLPHGLDTILPFGGLSIEQRQLICIARALLRKNKILILEEPKHRIGVETEKFIQTIIREHFHDCTVLIIAQRLEYVIDADRVMVVEGNGSFEFDHPKVLIQNETSYLRRLLNHESAETVKTLEDAAEKSFRKKMKL